jgi:hypothetical protein
LILVFNPEAIRPVRGTHHLRENEPALPQDEVAAKHEVV